MPSAPRRRPLAPCSRAGRSSATGWPGSACRCSRRRSRPSGSSTPSWPCSTRSATWSTSSSRAATRPSPDTHLDLRREHIDRPVLASHLCDFEELLTHDGCTGVAVMADRPADGSAVRRAQALPRLRPDLEPVPPRAARRGHLRAATSCRSSPRPSTCTTPTDELRRPVPRNWPCASASATSTA